MFLMRRKPVRNSLGDVRSSEPAATVDNFVKILADSVLRLADPD
jgi:hypothetical protein